MLGGVLFNKKTEEQEKKFPIEKTEEKEKVVEIDSANGGEILWFFGYVGDLKLKVIGDSGAAANCVGGRLLSAIEDKKFTPVWVKRERKVKISCPNGQEMQVLGEAQLDLKIGNKIIQLRVLVVKGLEADLILSYKFLRTNEMEILQKERANYLILNKLNVKVKLEELQPHQTHLFNIKTGKKKQIVYERKKPGKWVWTEEATKIEKTEEKGIVAPTTDITSGTEAIEKAKLFRAISKKGFMVVPCDIQEPGTREILDLATDVPVLIPNIYIQRENATLWEARRERKRDWIGVRYSLASEAEK